MKALASLLLSLLTICSQAVAQDMSQVQRIETEQQLAELIEEMNREKYGDLDIQLDNEDLYKWKERFVPFDPGADLVHKSRISLALAFLVFFGDEKHRDNVQNDDGKSYLTADVGDFVGGYGSVIIPAGAYAFGYLTNDKYTQDTGLLMGKSVLISAVVVQALKLTFHRHRPNRDVGPYKFDGPDYTDTENMSFPSGHTAAATAMATVLLDRYGDRSKYVPLLAYSLIGITAWSRVYDNAHWVSDTMVGALMGYLIASQILKKNTGADKGFHFSPVVDFEGNFMVHVQYTRRDKGKYPLEKTKRCQKELAEHTTERAAKMQCLKWDLKSKWAD